MYDLKDCLYSDSTTIRSGHFLFYIVIWSIMNDHIWIGLMTHKEIKQQC